MSKAGRSAGAYAFAFLCVAISTVLRIAIDPYVTGVQFTLFWPAVVIATLLGGFGPGVFCIVIGAAAADFFVLHPRYFFGIETLDDALDLLIFITLSLFMVILISLHKRATQDLEATKDRLRFALDAAELGWWDYDTIHDAVTWDVRARRLFKVVEAQTGIEELKKRIHPDDRETVWAAVEASLDPIDPKPYAIEYRITPSTGEMRWVETHGLTRFDGTGRERHADFMIGTARDITERKLHEEERVKRQERERFLIREVNHRAKNMLAVVDAIAHQTAARNPEDFIESFSHRLQALAANQDLVVRNDWHGVEIEHLVRAQLLHFADLLGSRIVADGPNLRLNPAAAQAIGLAIHELATNAGKYGALSADTGRVEVRWRVDGDTFTMSWTEREGPLVSAPERRGFGTVVMKQMAERSLGGQVSLSYAPSGVTWRLTCPATGALEP